LPGTIAGLVLLAVSVTPGFVFLGWREAREPARHFTPLREIAAVITASIACGSVAAALLAAVRWLGPGVTPDVGRFVRDGEVYLRRHYVEFAVWGLTALALACVIATVAALAWDPLNTRLGKSRVGLRVSSIASPIRHESGWAASFRRLPQADVYVGIELLDGTYFYGALDSYSPQVDESSDRSIVLCEPIDIRRGGGGLERSDVKTAVISAAQIRYVTTYYLPPSEGESRSS